MHQHRVGDYLESSPESPAGHQVNHEPAVCPWSRGSKQLPGLYWAKHDLQVARDDPSPPLSTDETHLRVLDVVLGSPVVERHGYPEAISAKVYKHNHGTGACDLLVES